MQKFLEMVPGYAMEICSMLSVEIFFSLILFFTILPLSLLLKNKSPYWQYGLWFLFMIRLILPTELSSPVSLRSTLDHISSLINSENNDNVDNSSMGLEEHGVKSTLQVFTYETEIPIFSVLISLLILLGISGFTILYFRRLLLIRTVVQNSRPVLEIDILKVIKSWRNKLRIKRRIRVVSSMDFDSPFTVGFLQPRIFLPASLVRGNCPEILETVIAHEMAHIKRFDDLQIKLINIIQIIYFFHPLVWFASAQLKIARERICDQLILTEKTITPKQYANSLLQVLLLNGHKPYYLLHFTGFTNRNKHLKLRFREILGGKKMKKSQKHFIFLTLFIFSLIILPMSSWQTSGATKNSAAKLDRNPPHNDNSEISFTSPVKTGKISSQFGMRMHPIYKKEMHHNGIDVASSIGTEVYSCADGTIEKAGVEGKYGKRILIRHSGGYQTLYAQLGEIFIEENQKIKKGDLIALIGESEFSTGPHLHFEIRLDGKSQNPEIYIDFSFLEMPD